MILGSCASSPGGGSVAMSPAPMAPPSESSGVVQSSRYVGSDIKPDSVDGLLKSRGEPSSTVESRPGLGTSSGYQRFERVESTTFYRRSDSPDVVASFHYNDDLGAKAMADLLGGGIKRTGLFATAGGRLKAGLVSYGSDAFPRLDAKGRQIVIGQPGQTYQIRLENISKQRLEVVTSVDSINVLTGKKAGTSQRGYVLEPKGAVNISGFRVSDSKVNTFTFSSVSASKAAGQGLEKNVGVIGLAVFEEDAAKAAMKLRQEQFQREDASAFPVTGR